MKGSKLIIFFCFFALLLGGYFIFTYVQKKKTVVSTPSVVALVVPAVADIKVPPSAEILPIKTIKPKPVAPPPPVGTDQFVVSLNTTSGDIAISLTDKEYLSDALVFTALLGTKAIAPGAYKISKGWTPAQLLQVLQGKPYMKWVVIPPGLRKEEIAALLAPALGWTTKQKNEWITKDTTTKPEYVEGVYAPNTYLIPVLETPVNVTTRLIAKFNEGFAPYLPEFTTKNIKWTSALTLASIVQREAASVADMPLIAGILWNRLDQNMMLDVDATLQYIRGNTGLGWWAPITVADKKIDSPFNTYKHTGLPPHPISNPSLGAIEAVLNPTSTDCLYYLHDGNRITHCAVTYAEHLANIEKYLKATP